MISAALRLGLLALPTAFATTYLVEVGSNGLQFTPDYVQAVAGDSVTFIFNPKNHTVTQSSFDAPCVPLDGGFDSGFMPVAAGDPMPSLTIAVNDTNPVWVHCKQTMGAHCGNGMVFAINPPADPSPQSFSAFQARAIAINGTAPTTTFTVPPPSATEWTTTAGNPTYTNAPAATTPVAHKILVGPNGQLVYDVANITAAVGDTVIFEFHPKNHTVTQSSFMHPCQPLADTSITGQVGFNSGFMPVSANATTFPTFQITINDTAPIWGFCGQTGHCGQGMVFAINAVETGPNNFEAFKALAQQINGTAKSNTGGVTSDCSTHMPLGGALVSAASLFIAAALF